MPSMAQVQYIINARKIHNPSVARLRGKATRKTPEGEVDSCDRNPILLKIT